MTTMGTLFGGDVHAGLSGLELDDDCFDLGDGITLRKTYAHLMAHFVMAFKPAPPGGFHPAPWKPATGGFTFDVSAELLVPAHLEKKFGSTVSVAKTVVFLLRLWVNPATTLPVFSNFPFAALPNTPDNQARLLPFEVQDRHFPLGVVGGRATPDALAWVKEHWAITQKLFQHNAEFALAVEAIDTGQFVQSTALALVSIWGALEALFSPSTTELKFRVSALIAAFLEPPGIERAKLQKEIAKLYDKRSAAAHGKPKHEPEDLLSSFNLLRRVLIAIITSGKVPSKNDLEGMLFGSYTADS
ncbi:MAG: hypothetical protein IPJ73_13430 [Zoogloea sp.]|nr:hypothetical protein [Zoogloea sp.]